ncbi:MAG: 2-C-methyl-D-erythritol 2,4-cyclodiphosphate synthase [Chlorobi bacterium]|nr:2-C-methyl-D-erythritol 2,4-cyclodiphosphate synthase [Chlorobiota bacterium]
MASYRVGSGWDVHRLMPKGKPLVLGGVQIDYVMGVEAHSDGDVVAHSLSDALLSAIGKDDIGSYFPDDDPQWENLEGKEMIKRVSAIVKNEGFSIENVVITIFAQYPKLKPYRRHIKESVVGWLDIEIGQVAVHFNTVERIGVIGGGVAIACHSMVLVERKF